MTTQFVPSENDFQIAYDIQGSGAALLLVHGFSHDRTMWHEYGWVEHFQSDFTVITMDVRGCGESSKSHEPADYSQQAHLADVMSVLDACHAERCIYWGWSFGGTIGSHLAAHTDRLAGAVMAGTYFGPIFTGERWQNANRELGKIAKAKRDGTLDTVDLPDEKRRFAEINDLDLLWARRRGVESWPAVEPAELQCPTLIYTGSEDGRIVENLEKQRASIEAAGLELHSFDGLDHRKLVSERDAVAKVIEPFIRSIT